MDFDDNLSLPAPKFLSRRNWATEKSEENQAEMGGILAARSEQNDEDIWNEDRSKARKFSGNGRGRILRSVSAETVEPGRVDIDTVDSKETRPEAPVSKNQLVRPSRSDLPDKIDRRVDLWVSTDVLQEQDAVPEEKQPPPALIKRESSKRNVPNVGPKSKNLPMMGMRGVEPTYLKMMEKFDVYESEDIQWDD